MGNNAIDVGELVYVAVANFTDVAEYGISMNDLLSGAAAPHPAGVRIDVAFQGSVEGPRISGSVAGIDYINVRADGRFQLHIHAHITTDDGEHISLFAEGVAIPEEGSPVVKLRENASLLTASSEYSWVNQVLGWGVGTVDLSTGEIRVEVYAA